MTTVVGHINLFLFASHLVVTIKASSDFCPSEESFLTLLRKVSDCVRGVKKIPSNQWASHYAQCKSFEQQGTLLPTRAAGEAKTQTQRLCGF